MIFKEATLPLVGIQSGDLPRNPALTLNVGHFSGHCRQADSGKVLLHRKGVTYAEEAVLDPLIKEREADSVFEIEPVPVLVVDNDGACSGPVWRRVRRGSSLATHK